MSSNSDSAFADVHRQLLLRCLDGVATNAEQQSAEQLLLASREARDFLRDLGEHAVGVADLQRTGQLALQMVSSDRAVVPGETVGTEFVSVRRSLFWRAGLPLLLAFVLCAVSVAGTLLWQQRIPGGIVSDRPLRLEPSAMVTRATGSVVRLDSAGTAESTAQIGQLLHVGDALRSDSCSGWVDVRLQSGLSLTVAGYSLLRRLESAVNGVQLELRYGNLWISPSALPSDLPLTVQLPTAAVFSRGAVVSFQTTDMQSVVRVHAGQATVQPSGNGSATTVTAGCQVVLDVRRQPTIQLMVQPAPQFEWSLDQSGLEFLSHGRITELNERGDWRIQARPLLWPMADRPPVLLHVIGIPAARCARHPLRLTAGSMLRFRGRTTVPGMVRFGFSAQKMAGVFAGKFEVDLNAEQLRAAAIPGVDGGWQVQLPMPAFLPLDGQPVGVAEDLELLDVYALTIVTDHGLELDHVELLRLQ